MKKTYISPLKHFVFNGLRFTAFVFPRTGSFFTTSDPAEQRLIEESRSFTTGNITLAETVNTRPVPKPKPLSVNPDEMDLTLTEYSTDSLQTARDIVYAIMDDRNIERTSCPNRKAILNAAERLGINFPNL